MLSFLILACSQAKQEKQVLQFNLDSLLDFHARQLSKTGARLNKSTSLKDTVKFLTGAIQTVSWEKELEPFRMISAINKPIYRNAYTVTVERDPKSNLMVKSWKAKANEPVRLVKLYFLNNLSTLRKLETVVEKRNFIVSSRQKLEMDFNLFGNSQLERFAISGSQKFFWDNPQPFSLTAIVESKKRANFEVK